MKGTQTPAHADARALVAELARRKTNDAGGNRALPFNQVVKYLDGDERAALRALEEAETYGWVSVERGYARIPSSVSITDAGARLVATINESDETLARRLIAELARRQAAEGGARRLARRDEVPDIAGTDLSRADAAILHAEGQGWVKVNRAFATGSSIVGVTLLPTGFAEAGRNPHAPSPGHTVNVSPGATYNHAVATAPGATAAAGGKTAKAKTHTGDTNVRMGFRAKVESIWRTMFGKSGGN